MNTSISVRDMFGQGIAASTTRRVALCRLGGAVLAALLAASGKTGAGAQEAGPHAMTEALPSPLDDLVAAWNAHDPQRLATLYTDEAVIEEEVVEGVVVRGQDAIAAWAVGHLAAIPDLRLEVRSGFVADDWAVLEWTYTGTYTGQFPGLPAGTGQTISFPGVTVYELRDGKIAHAALYYDNYFPLMQIGVLPAPATLEDGTPSA